MKILIKLQTEKINVRNKQKQLIDFYLDFVKIRIKINMATNLSMMSWSIGGYGGI